MLRKRAVLFDVSVVKHNLSQLTLKMIRVPLFPRNLQRNRLPWSMICYSGGSRTAGTLWSTFPHISQQGLAFVYTHPHLLFICWLCIGKVVILEPGQQFSVCCWHFHLQSAVPFLKSRLQEKLHLPGTTVKPASPMIMELYQGKGLSESSGWVWLVSLFLLLAGLFEAMLSH